MTFVLALLAAIVGGAIGAGLGVTIAAMLAPALGISSFEGASGYFAVFIGGPIGALLGIVLGAVLVLRWRGSRGFGAIGGRLSLVVIGIMAIATGVMGVLYLSQDIVNPNGAAPQLVFEIRLPAGAMPPGPNERPIELTTSKNRMPALMDREVARKDGDRPVIAGLVEMYYRTSQRMLVMTLPDKTDVLFNIKLASVPKHSPEFSAWHRADYIGEPGKSQTRRATATDNYEIRYRADWAGEN
jgi:MFS family permease